MKNRFPKVRYANIDQLSIAYQVWGDADKVLVYVPGIVSHLEVTLEIKGYVDWLERLSRNFKVIIFDKRGQGMSDRETSMPGIEARADDITAVVKAEGVKRFSLFGLSEGAAIALFYAASFPARIDALAILGGFPRVSNSKDYMYLNDGTESLNWIKNWGDGFSGYSLCPHVMPQMKEIMGKFERMTCNPRTLTQMIETNMSIDIRAILPEIKVRTLVCHSRDDKRVPKENGRYIAEHVKGAKYIEYPNGGHLPYFGLEKQLAEDLDFFFRQSSKTNELKEENTDRLATILFTDIVDSTAKLSDFGDKEWSHILDEHDSIIQILAKKFYGNFIKNTGDGALLVFDGPIRAIDCAIDFSKAVKSLGIEIRCGLHIGSVEWRGKDISGIAVNIASRVMDIDKGNNIVITKNLANLISGSGLKLSNFGRHSLKGIQGTWSLLKVST